MSFGENLQYYRAREGLTQEELAERLEVSRQSVSKWESNTSFPEMEKLMTLCSLFQTNLDTLVRGDAQAVCQEDAVGYDRHMNAFSNAVAGGVGLILFGVAAALCLYGLAGIPDTWCGAVILSAVAVAVAILVVAGMNHDHFAQQHPTLPQIYTPAQRDAYARRFPYLIALPIAAILIGVVWLVLLSSWAEAGATAGRPPWSLSSCWTLPCLSRCWYGQACAWRSTRSRIGIGNTTPVPRPKPGAKKSTGSAGPLCWWPPLSFWPSALAGWLWSTITATPSAGAGDGSSTPLPEYCVLWSAISWIMGMKKNKGRKPSTRWRASFF